MIFLRQSTAVTVKLGPFVDSGDANTDESGLTISQADVRLSKNGGDFAQKNESSSATYDEIGYYDCALNTTDTNTAGELLIAVHESGALHVWLRAMVLTADAYDTLFHASNGSLRADVRTITNNAITTASINDGAFTNAKFADNFLTAAKIASDAITSAKIADGAITAAKLASNAITSAKIAADAIGATQIASDAITAAKVAADVGLEFADALLGRNVAGGSSSGRLVKEALYLLRNLWDITDGTLTVYETDDTTPSWTADVSTSAGNPITQVDPD